MGEYIRTFIAIDPDDTSAEKIFEFSNKLRTNIKGDINWTKRENLHFTLKFLGEISPDRVEEVSNILQTISELNKSFKVSISGIGFFPDIKRPRILWVGARDGRDEMERLAHIIEDELSCIGFEKESREFKAHLTLARIKSPHIKIDHKFIDGLSKNTICQFEVKNIILYRSDLFPAGPRYTIIKTFDLLKE